MVVTSVAARAPEEGAKSDVTLNGCLRVSGVERVASADGPGSFRLPLSGWGEKRYADVRVLSRSLYDHILAALDGRGVAARRCDAKAFSFIVGTVQRLGSSGRIANAEVIFMGELSVLFGVGRGGRVQYPSHPAEDGASERDVELLDPGLKARVEAAILKKVESVP